MLDDTSWMVGLITNCTGLIILGKVVLTAVAVGLADVKVRREVEADDEGDSDHPCC